MLREILWFISVSLYLGQEVFSMSGLLGLARSFDESVTKSFDDFEKKFGKHYSSPAEFDYRLKVFSENLKKLDEVEGRQRKVVGINKFSDETWDEFSSKHLMKSKGFGEEELISLEDLVELSDEDIEKKIRGRMLKPTSNDSVKVKRKISWRQFASRAFDQKDCSACWAFTATGAVEIALARGSKPGGKTSLSSQHLIDCVSPDFNCEGGNPVTALQFLKQVGAYPETIYPYAELKGRCREPQGRISPAFEFRRLKPTVANLLKALQLGPVTGVHVGNVTLKNYVGGIMRDSDCSGDFNHSAVIVGYDLTANPPFFEFKNSWGEDFGDKGFYKMAIGSFKDSWKGYCRLLDHNFMAVVF